MRKKSSDYMRCLYWLYLALSKRENYYELNSPTAFGDPEYARYVGMVTGILMVTGWEEVATEDQIIIKTKKKDSGCRSDQKIRQFLQRKS